jgi:hypothetical protein
VFLFFRRWWSGSRVYAIQDTHSALAWPSFSKTGQARINQIFTGLLFYLYVNMDRAARWKREERKGNEVFGGD